MRKLHFQKIPKCVPIMFVIRNNMRNATPTSYAHMVTNTFIKVSIRTFALYLLLFIYIPVSRLKDMLLIINSTLYVIVINNT